jgi:hypothetical protein
VAQLYRQALGSLFVAVYNSHGYSGGILTHGVHWYVSPFRDAISQTASSMGRNNVRDKSYNISKHN